MDVNCKKSIESGNVVETSFERKMTVRFGESGKSNNKTVENFEITTTTKPHNFKVLCDSLENVNKLII